MGIAQDGREPGGSNHANVNLYNGHYGQLATAVQADVRRETYDEDLGQASWITAAEARRWFALLELGAGQHALEVASFRTGFGSFRPGGRVLFTDPIVVTGQLSDEEIQIRSSIGFFLFTPAGCNERLLEQVRFTVRAVRDTTDAVASVSRKWHEARARRRDELVALEGDQTFDGLQRFLNIVFVLSSERRLSRFMYLAVK